MVDKGHICCELLVGLTAARFATSIGEDVGTCRFRVLSQLLLLFKPFLEFVTCFEPCTTLTISAVDWVLVLDRLIYLPLQLSELICFLH